MQVSNKDLLQKNMDAFDYIVDLLGQKWLQEAVNNNHPIINMTRYWPGVDIIVEIAELLRLCKDTSGEEVFENTKNRLKTCDYLSYGSLYDELVYLWCLNTNGLNCKKLLENGNKKSIDLEMTFEGKAIGVEITRLLETEDRNRAYNAFMQLSRFEKILENEKSNQLEFSMKLERRPWSKNNIIELEKRIEEVRENAIIKGLDYINLEGKIKYIAWLPSYTDFISEVHKKLGLKIKEVTMDFSFASTIAPFRVAQKIKEKVKQSSYENWLLFISVNEELRNEYEANDLVSYTGEYLADYPSLAACIIIHKWSGAIVNPLNMNTDEISVETISDSVNLSHNQTIILKNNHSNLANKEQLWVLIRRVAQSTFWETTIKSSLIEISI